MRGLTLAVFCFLFINQCFSKYLLVETEDKKSSEDYEDKGAEVEKVEAEVVAEAEAEAEAPAKKEGGDYWLGPDAYKCRKGWVYSNYKKKMCKRNVDINK